MAESGVTWGSQLPIPLWLVPPSWPLFSHSSACHLRLSPWTVTTQVSIPKAEGDPVLREQPLAQGVGPRAAPGVMWGLGCVGWALLCPKPTHGIVHQALGEGGPSPQCRAGAPGPFQRDSSCGEEEKVRQEEGVGKQGSTEGRVRRLCMSGTRMRSRGNQDFLPNTTFLNVQICYY